jgi:hypothetical protein
MFICRTQEYLCVPLACWRVGDLLACSFGGVRRIVRIRRIKKGEARAEIEHPLAATLRVWYPWQ